LFRYRTGCPWRDLPEGFGPWQTVLKRHAQFSKDGTWDRVLQALLVRAHDAGQLDWQLSIDSTISRVHGGVSMDPAFIRTAWWAGTAARRAWKQADAKVAACAEEQGISKEGAWAGIRAAVLMRKDETVERVRDLADPLGWRAAAQAFEPMSGLLIALGLSAATFRRTT